MSLKTLRAGVVGLPVVLDVWEESADNEPYFSKANVLALIDAEIAERGDGSWVGLRAHLKAWARSQDLLDTQVDELLRVAKNYTCAAEGGDAYLIDRNDLLEWFEIDTEDGIMTSMDEDGEETVRTDQVKDYLRSLGRWAAEGGDAGWISVENRLPEEGKAVLTVCSCDDDERDFDATRFPYVNYWLQRHDRETGWYPASGLVADERCEEVTHWQELTRPAPEEK